MSAIIVVYDFRRNKVGLSRDVASTGLSGMEMADPHYPERYQVAIILAKMPSSTSSILTPRSCMMSLAACQESSPCLLKPGVRPNFVSFSKAMLCWPREIKYDGDRCQIHKQGNQFKILSRAGNDNTEVNLGSVHTMTYYKYNGERNVSS